LPKSNNITGIRNCNQTTSKPRASAENFPEGLRERQRSSNITKNPPLSSGKLLAHLAHIQGPLLRILRKIEDLLGKALIFEKKMPVLKILGHRGIFTRKNFVFQPLLGLNSHLRELGCFRKTSACEYFLLF